MIDAHVHVWDLGARDQPWIAAGSSLRRTFTLDDLRTTLAPTPVERVVLVQVINDAGETAEFLGCAGDALVAGVIGWADLADPTFPDVFAQLRATRALVGVRHQALAEADPAGWLVSTPVRSALGELERVGVPFDLILRAEHFPAALHVARAHPSLRFVLDHLGKAPIASRRLEPWAGRLRELAAEPNVVCKLSGLQTIAPPDWAYADLSPFVDVALDAFGTERLIFGSDWPVSTQAATYAQILDVAERACAGLSAGERSAVLGGTASAVYRLV